MMWWVDHLVTIGLIGLDVRNGSRDAYAQHTKRKQHPALRLPGPCYSRAQSARYPIRVP